MARRARIVSVGAIGRIVRVDGGCGGEGAGVLRGGVAGEEKGDVGVEATDEYGECREEPEVGGKSVSSTETKLQIMPLYSTRKHFQICLSRHV